MSPRPCLASHPTDMGLLLSLTHPAFSRAGLPLTASPDIQLQEHPSSRATGGGLHCPTGRVATQRVRVHIWGPWTLTPYPRDQSAPKNANFSTNVHFLRHFQQHSPGLPVHVSSPAVWRMHHCSSPLPDCRGGWCRALEPQVILTSSQPCWSWFDSGQEEECVHDSPPHGGLRSVLTPKCQNQHSKPQPHPLLQTEKSHQSTQPLPALFSLGF